MNKYSASAEDELEMFDEETLEQLAAYSEIYQYRLKSTYFPVEGIRIPSYKGEMTLRLHGTDTLARYVRFLLRFGEYSGIGIKTAMGMGAIRVTEGRTRDD
jgi:CRISPR-associated endoribonuclease Cas6